MAYSSMLRCNYVSLSSSSALPRLVLNVLLSMLGPRVAWSGAYTQDGCSCCDLTLPGTPHSFGSSSLSRPREFDGASLTYSHRGRPRASSIADSFSLYWATLFPEDAGDERQAVFDVALKSLLASYDSEFWNEGRTDTDSAVDDEPRCVKFAPELLGLISSACCAPAVSLVHIKSS
ncbi:hypothetical protein BKA93DRAFT_460160 [Sparassis latifolia]